MRLNNKVTVLMPVYNAQRYVGEALESILGQDFNDFSVLVIDDASTDRTPEIVASYDDPRLHVIRNKHTAGVARSLNTGLELIDSEYIMRMDADDISHRSRMAVEAAFLDANPEVALVGCWVETIGPDDMNVPTDWEVEIPEAIVHQGTDYLRTFYLFMPTICHPSVMIRTSVLTRRGWAYDPTTPAEDFLLFKDLVFHEQAAIINFHLLHYRKHPESVSSVGKEQTLINLADVNKRYLARYGIALSDEQARAFVRVGLASRYLPSEDDFREVEKIIFGDIVSNPQIGSVFDPRYVRGFLEDHRRIAKKARAYANMHRPAT